MSHSTITREEVQEQLSETMETDSCKRSSEGIKKTKYFLINSRHHQQDLTSVSRPEFLTAIIRGCDSLYSCRYLPTFEGNFPKILPDYIHIREHITYNQIINLLFILKTIIDCTKYIKILFFLFLLNEFLFQAPLHRLV
jgi:hypothetical protein